jgi:hypothetical protein
VKGESGFVSIRRSCSIAVVVAVAVAVVRQV